MMQTAEPWHCYDPASAARLVRGFTTGRRSLCQREMSPVLVVVANVIIHKVFQMLLVQNNHMIEQVSTATADPPFRNAVLPRTSDAGSLGLDNEVLDRADHFFIELRAAIKDQIAGRGVVREGFTQLLNHPSARRVFGHIEVQDAPPVMRNDEEAAEDSKSERWHREEFHSGNRHTMMIQKRHPSLRRFEISRRVEHPAGAPQENQAVFSV